MQISHITNRTGEFRPFSFWLLIFSCFDFVVYLKIKINYPKSRIKKGIITPPTVFLTVGGDLNR